MISINSDFRRYNMLFNMQGPIFVSLCKALRIRSCSGKCRAGLRNQEYRSVRGLVSRLSEGVSLASKADVRERILMCLYFSSQDIITDWHEFAHEITEGPVCEDLWEIFSEWREISYPRAINLYRTVVLALKADPSLTCEQANFFLKPLEESALKEITEILYKFLLRSCAKVSIIDLGARKKQMNVQYLRHGEVSSFVCLMP